jgi:hypothetical protein
MQPEAMQPYDSQPTPAPALPPYPVTPAGLPHRRLGAWYGRAYLLLTGGLVTIVSAVPLFQRQVYDSYGGYSIQSPTVWGIMAGEQGTPALVIAVVVIGLVLVAALAALLVFAALRAPRTPWRPAGTAALATAIALLLIVKPGAGDYGIVLNPAGRILLVLSLCTAVAALAHAIHLAVRTGAAA